MSTRNKQVRNSETQTYNQPQSEPSPWTEPFQRAEAAAERKSEATEQAQAAPAQENHQDEPTHNALSTIFNGR